MKIVCDACSAKYSIADEKVRGKVFKIRCKKCSNIIVVRGTAEAAAESEHKYDQKETKVFDYSGYDSPQEAAKALETGAADDRVWHVVIDQEQVGPLDVAGVRAKFEAGEIDTESYIWKEGFGDWERLVDVAEFASLAPADASSGGAMFGGLDMDDGATVQSDPADLFSAAAGASLGQEDPGSDLFGGLGDSGASPMAAAPSGGLFDAGNGASAEAAAPAASPQLTGQRNENSVLFSLNNLAALASDSPKPAMSPSTPSQPAAMGASNTGGSEGSGLIDIRSMASAYLGDSPSAGMGTGSTDDLPVFSQGSFETASPVLLPTAAAPSNNKLLYMLMGVIGVLVVAAAVLIIVVLKGGDSGSSGETVAAATPDEGGEKPTPGDTVPKEAAGTEVADGTGTEGAGEEAAPEAAVPDPEEAAPEAAAAEKPKSTRSERKRSSRSSRSERSTRPERPTRTVKKDPPRRTTAESATGSGGCDEVTCLVEPNKACCKRYKKSSQSSGSSSSSNLPDRPSRSDIKKGIAKVRGRVSSCGAKHGGKGKVTVKITIGGNGKVKSAVGSGGSSALRSCVASAVKKARFAKSQKGASVKYPFVF